MLVSGRVIPLNSHDTFKSCAVETGWIDGSKTMFKHTLHWRGQPELREKPSKGFARETYVPIKPIVKNYTWQDLPQNQYLSLKEIRVSENHIILNLRCFFVFPDDLPNWVLGKPNLPIGKIIVSQITLLNRCMVFLVQQKQTQQKNWVVVSNILIFIPTWGNYPIWLEFFNWVETTT